MGCKSIYIERRGLRMGRKLSRMASAPNRDVEANAAYSRRGGVMLSGVKPGLLGYSFVF